jgi:GT2 family glycosyltransferase
MKSWPRVSVIMSNYNGMKLNLLTESLNSILKNNYPNLEILLVDNASTDNSVKEARKLSKKNPQLKIVQNRINMYSQGLNLGIKNSTGEYLAFFNNDVVVKNGYFQKFIKYLEKHPKAALAQGKLVSYFDHSIIDSAGETMDRFGNPITIGAGIQTKKGFKTTKEVLSVSGSCSILRRSVIKEIGVFGDRYGIGYEDLDLALRAHLNGYQVIYYPQVSAYHKRASTDLAPMVRVKVRWHFNKNRISTIIKNYPWSFIFINLPFTILIYICAGLWEILLKRKIPLGLTRFTSLFWIISNLHQILRERQEVQSMIKTKTPSKIINLLSQKSFSQSLLSFLKAR